MFPLGCRLRGNFIEGDLLIGQWLQSVWVCFVAANKNPRLSSTTFTHVRYWLHGRSHATAALVRRPTVYSKTRYIDGTKPNLTGDNFGEKKQGKQTEEANKKVASKGHRRQERTRKRQKEMKKK